MAKARAAFLTRLKAYRGAVASPVIIDRAPSHRTHNAEARLIRNGLSVVGYALLEDFIRSRAGEILDWLTHRRLDYSNLPRRLQDAATHEAVRALGAQYDVRRRTIEPTMMLAEVGSSFVTLGSTSMKFTPLSLGWRRSNLSGDEVKHMVAAFEVSDPWRSIEQIGRRSGAGSVAAQSAFENAAQARHVAAHQATANVQPTDLQYFAQDAFAIALGFDALLSRAARLVAAGGSGSTPPGVQLQSSIRLRILQKDGNAAWREFLEGGGTTIRREAVYQTLEAGARRRGRRRGDLLVIQDTVGRPNRWITLDVP